MAVDEATKAEIIQRAESGQAPKEIAEALGIKPTIAVYGVIKQHRIRSGLEEPPAKGKRRVRESKTITYEEEPDFIPGLPAASGVASPLFPSQSHSEVTRIEVTRIVARPRSMGVGVMGIIDPQADSAVIEEAWGGGRYLVRGFNAQGRKIAENALEVGGLSKTKDDGEEGLTVLDDLEIERLGFGGRQDMTQTLLAVMTKQNEHERIAAEARVREYRELQASKAEQDRQFFAQMMAQQQAAAQQQMALANQQMQQTIALITSAQKQTSSQELGGIISLVGKIMDIKGGGDPVDSLVTNMPQMLDSIAKMKAMGPSPTHGQQGRPPANADEHMQAIGIEMVKILMSQGWSQEEAVKHVNEVGEYTAHKHNEKVKRANGNQQQRQQVPPPQTQEQAPPAQAKS